MKFVHLADLHIGKSVCGFSMLEDQRYILEQIQGIIIREAPDAVLIAGDIYDKPVPSARSVQLLDDFLCGLSKYGCEVFVISGNHDSPERLSFGGRLMDASGVHFAPVYSGRVEPFTLEDEYGEVCVWLLPFVKPADVRAFFPGAEISSYTGAVRTTVQAMEPDSGARNVLVTHQFVTGAKRCGSEEISVGGADNVDASVFEGFDYVALGHIHGPQSVGDSRIRYCGTPLKYSFSEVSHKKSVTIVELGARQEPPAEKSAGAKRSYAAIDIRTVPLEPLHDMREIRGSYDEVTARDFYKDTAVDDYLRVTLTDEEDIPDGYAKLRLIYPHLMRLDYDNRRTRAEVDLPLEAAGGHKRPEELFAGFYEEMNGAPMTEEQDVLVRDMIGKIWGGPS